jgi:Fibronectin type III domain
MARFPRSEAKIAALAQLVARGLDRAPRDFPAPPVPADELQARLDEFNAATVAVVAAETLTRERHVAKDEALDRLVDGVKADLRYAEVMVRDQPEKLGQVGWGLPRTRVSIETPGEVRDIAIRAEGDTWVVLDWNPPVDGGEVASYTIQCRNHVGGSWEDIATSVDTEEVLRGQPRGVELEYRVTAMNKAGTGRPSAIVKAVL